MIKVARTIIEEVDIDNLMLENGIGSYVELCELSGISYPSFLRSKNGESLNLRESTWKKIEKALTKSK